jgi:hypothetical protein
MTKTAKRFTKGQIVFVASTSWQYLKTQTPCAGGTIGAVIERQVESCGLKQITFFNRAGFDCVFSRSEQADSGRIFATADEAFQYLKDAACVDLVCKEIRCDADKDLFQQSWTIAEK